MSQIVNHELICVHCQKKYESPNKEKVSECINCYSNKWETNTVPFCKVANCTYCVDYSKAKNNM